MDEQKAAVHSNATRPIGYPTDRRPGARIWLCALTVALATYTSTKQSFAQDELAPPSSAPPAPPATPGTEAAPPPSTLVAADGYPLAGRVGEYFYLRDANDDFRIYFNGRAQFDGYAPIAAGVGSAPPGSGLQPTFFLRRARPELSGEFVHRWQWMVAGEWGRTTVDDGSGTATTQSCSASAATGALVCTDRSSAVEAPSYQAQPTDVYVNYRAAPEFNIEGGQIKIPFSLDNRTSENVPPFLESSLPVRAIGAPTVRDIGVMAWGELPHSLLHYEAGVFGGDGPNRTNQDANFDFIGRVFGHPFAETGGPLRKFQIGASGHYGVRDARTVGYDYTTFTTQEGFAFWRPTYTDSNGNLVHIIPSSRQITVGGELYWPISIVDLSSEFIYADHGTREAVDGYQLQYPYTQRYGTMKGYGYYVQLSVWVVGDRQYVRRPGYLDPPHIDFKEPLRPTTESLELLAKVEQLKMTYASASRAGTPDAKSPDGDIVANTLSFGINYWATRRVRVSLDYDVYFFPGSEPVSASYAGAPQQTASQRAVAPGQILAKGVDDSARETSHAISEVSARLAVGF